MGVQERRELARGMLVKGKAAGSPKGMEHNKKVMEKAGYSKKRAVGTAYGEVGMEKMGRRHESEGIKKYEEEKKKHHEDMHHAHMKEAEHHMRHAERHMKKCEMHGKKAGKK